MTEPLLITAASTADAATGFKLSVIIGGVVGSALSLRFADSLNRIQRITAVISGALIAAYLAPPFAAYFGIQSFEGAVGFLFGLFGLSLAAKIFEELRKADVWGFITARFGKPPASGE